MTTIIITTTTRITTHQCIPPAATGRRAAGATLRLGGTTRKRSAVSWCIPWSSFQLESCLSVEPAAKQDEPRTGRAASTHLGCASPHAVPALVSLAQEEREREQECTGCGGGSQQQRICRSRVGTTQFSPLHSSLPSPTPHWLVNGPKEKKKKQGFKAKTINLLFSHQLTARSLLTNGVHRQQGPGRTDHSFPTPRGEETRAPRSARSGDPYFFFIFFPFLSSTLFGTLPTGAGGKERIKFLAYRARQRVTLNLLVEGKRGWACGNGMVAMLLRTGLHAC